MMKKKSLNILICGILVLISITAFFAKYLKIDAVFSSSILGILIILVAGFLAYINYDNENKTVRTYMFIAAGILGVLGLLPLLLVLLPYTFTMSVPITLHKIMLLAGSLFTLFTNLNLMNRL